MVGSSAGNLCEPVFIVFCFFQLRLQVGLDRHLPSAKFELNKIRKSSYNGTSFQNYGRHRAFSFLFPEGENEELNASQTVESHSFPQHFVESKEQLGLAPAAVVVSRREPYDSCLALQSLDYNRQIRSQSPAIG